MRWLVLEYDEEIGLIIRSLIVVWRGRGAVPCPPEWEREVERERERGVEIADARGSGREWVGADSVSSLAIIVTMEKSV